MDRLDFIASLTKGLDTIVDVGCDHAYTLINAITKYGVNKGYGLDVVDGPIEAAKRNVSDASLEDKIEIIKSNGFMQFDKPVDGIVISGMGGMNIVDILSYDIDYVKNCKKIILSAHNDTPKLRFFLINNMFSIDDEFMIEDNKHIYEILVVSNKKLSRKYDYFDMIFGPVLREKKPELFIKKYSEALEKTKNALKMAKDPIAISKLKMEKAMYEEILKW